MTADDLAALLDPRDLEAARQVAQDAPPLSDTAQSVLLSLYSDQPRAQLTAA